MKKELVFRGAATALVTPFDSAGIDFAAMAKMIEFQLTNGIDALVVCGTTGESATLSDAEKRSLIEFTVRQTRGRVPVIAGTGGNCTARAASLSEFAAKAGADALLVVTPYYNKCTQAGLVSYYRTISEASGLPYIAYSVPARTGMRIEPRTALEISLDKNAAGLKDAGDSISETAKTISLCGSALPVYSGNDDRILPVLSLGGKGVVSAAANLIPGSIKRLCNLYFDCRVSAAAKLQTALIPLCEALFREVNPIPLKAALAAEGMCRNILRAPLTELSEQNLRALIEAISDFRAEGDTRL